MSSCAIRCRRAGQAGEGQIEFLARILGLTAQRTGMTKTNQVVIVDMNAVSDDVVELFCSVLARMTFRLLRQADPRNRFPVHLLLEEAHRYVASTPSRYALDAAKVFERIAKEGRKYGMFLMVASQRPSELSKTVLSQCSNFVVHRIQNPGRPVADPSDDAIHFRSCPQATAISSQTARPGIWNLGQSADNLSRPGCCAKAIKRRHQDRGPLVP